MNSAVADIASLVGNYAAGEQAAKARIVLAPKDALGYRSLGRLYFVQGKLEACLEQLRIAVRLQPRDASHRLMLVDVFKRAKRLGQAELELEGILAIDPNNVEAKGHLKALRQR